MKLRELSHSYINHHQTAWYADTNYRRPCICSAGISMAVSTSLYLDEALEAIFR
jgi:hypothetical protein